MRILLLLAIAFASLPARSAPDSQETLNIAAASDLRFAMGEILDLYAKENKAEVKVTFGSSGKFRSQILQGAPFDIFFSADSENAEVLVKAGKTAGEAFPYAKGRLSLWVRKESKLKLEEGLAILRGPAVKRIAIANPLHAPYGRIAEEALGKAGLREEVKAKLTFGDDISRTAQFVESGAADVGLLATSLAEAPVMREKGRGVPLNPSLYTPLRQAGVLLKGPREKAAASFRTFFAGKEVRRILLRYGLEPL